MNETLKTLLERRSIRRYLPQQVDHGTLDQILQAGMYAPSAKGRQSATLVVVQDEKTLQELCLDGESATEWTCVSHP